MYDQQINQRFAECKESLESSLGHQLIISGLSGPLRVFQRKNGHRYSTDDALTSWYALEKCKTAKTALDLGSGIGSVGLAVLDGLGKESSLTCVEAQDISFKLLKANIECNSLTERVEAIFEDLRNLNLGRKFELITGSPPYFPVGTATLPRDSQKAYARFELRGTVEDYAKAAKRHLEDDGTFVFCFPYQQQKRAIKLVENVGFKICSIKDVVPRPGKAPLFSLYKAKLNWEKETEIEEALIVADENEKYTDIMLEVQKSRGFGQLGTN